MKPDIGRESRFLPIPPAFDASVKGSPRRNTDIRFRIEKKLEWFGYPIVKKFQDMITRLREYTNVKDGRTDTLMIASRGNKTINEETLGTCSFNLELISNATCSQILTFFRCTLYRRHCRL